MHPINLQTALVVVFKNAMERLNVRLISSFRITTATALSPSSSPSSSSTSATLSRLRAVFLWLIICGFAEIPIRHSAAVGYSYSSFVGPVSGPERKVWVYDEPTGAARVDFIAKPEYEFAYGIEDGPTQVLQNRQETRDGDAVKGVYSVLDPDGSLRSVKYTADDANGFQAEIITNRLTDHQGHNKPTHAHAAGGEDAIIWQPVRALQTSTTPHEHERVTQHVTRNNANEAFAAAAAAVEDDEGDDDADDDAIDGLAENDDAAVSIKPKTPTRYQQLSDNHDSESGSKSQDDDDDDDVDDSYEDALEEEAEDEADEDDYGESSKYTQSSEEASDEYY